MLKLMKLQLVGSLVMVELSMAEQNMVVLMEVKLLVVEHHMVTVVSVVLNGVNVIKDYL